MLGRWWGVEGVSCISLSPIVALGISWIVYSWIPFNIFNGLSSMEKLWYPRLPAFDSKPSISISFFLLYHHTSLPRLWAIAFSGFDLTVATTVRPREGHVLYTQTGRKRCPRTYGLAGRYEPYPWQNFSDWRKLAGYHIEYLFVTLNFKTNFRINEFLATFFSWDMQ